MSSFSFRTLMNVLVPYFHDFSFYVNWWAFKCQIKLYILTFDLCFSFLVQAINRFVKRSSFGFCGTILTTEKFHG